jgi:hypothetical protein
MAMAASAQRLVNCGGGGVSGQSMVTAASAVGWLRQSSQLRSYIDKIKQKETHILDQRQRAMPLISWT